MKYKKYFKIKYNNNITKQYSHMSGGDIGLKSLVRTNLTADQISSVTKSLKRIIKKKNFLIVNAIPFWTITKKPRDVRMGRGKGTPSLVIFPLRKGKVLLEVKGVDQGIAIRALKISSNKLPGIYRIITKNDKGANSSKGC